MTDTEKKALALVNEIAATRGTSWPCVDRANDSRWEALCRAIEQHEAFRQEVSDAVEAYLGHTSPWPDNSLRRFIIAKPDPLVEALNEALLSEQDMGARELADNFRAALAARGLTITETKE